MRRNMGYLKTNLKLDLNSTKRIRHLIYPWRASARVWEWFLCETRSYDLHSIAFDIILITKERKGGECKYFNPFIIIENQKTQNFLRQTEQAKNCENQNFFQRKSVKKASYMQTNRVRLKKETRIWNPLKNELPKTPMPEAHKEKPSTSVIA